jgi:hypothetical protein
MKFLLTGAALLLFSITIYAQVEKCGTSDYNKRLMKQDPLFELNAQLIEKHAEAYAKGDQPGSRSVITIPVVFHIVYEANLENITDAQVFSQINVLNEDFRRLNQNFEGQTPAAFKPLAADVEIEFCLAKTDPQGNPATGINRYPTNVSVFSNQNDKIKFRAQGGADAWPRDRYLNIWVCELESPLLGFAQFPGGPAATDGIVLSYKVVGRTPENPQTGANNLGKTASHEVGHWLNLIHIWGNETEGCADTDQLNDTPNQDKANTGRPVFPRISCGNGPNGDMFVNYMDYTDDICHTMFTNGQKQRMRAVLAPGGSRASLTSSTTCFNNVEPERTCADTLRYPFAGTKTLYQASPQGTGYVSGTSSKNAKAKAEFFAASGQSKQLKGAWFDFGVAKQGSAPAGTQIRFKVWSNNGTGQSPGDVQAEKSIPLTQIIQDVNLQRSTWVKFDQPATFGNGFYIGFELSQQAGYELALFTGTDGQNNSGTAWEQQSDGMWRPYSSAVSWDIDVSHAVYPFLEVPDLRADFILNDSSICVGQSAVFQALDNANFYQWKFTGGVPAVEDSSVAVIRYPNKGAYSVELRVASACFKDTVKRIHENVLKVNPYPPTPFLEYDGVKLYSSVTTGTFDWYRNNNLIAGAKQSFLIPTLNGIYRLRVTQLGCSTTSPPFDIEGVGLEEHNQSQSWVLLPNPAEGTIRLKKNNEYAPDLLRVDVYGYGGKLVYSKTLESSDYQNGCELNLEYLNNGIYFVQLDTKRGPLTKRLVIVH